VVTVVKTDPEAGAAGVSLLILEQKMEGVSIRKLKKLGWHSSDTAELNFDNVRVPVENLIGQEGRGFYYLMNGLQLERLCAVPAAVTGCEKAIEVSLQYMSEREAFGKPINRFQVLRHRIAQLASEVEALKAFSYHCCEMYANDIYDVKLCSMAKLLATELAEKVATECLQFFGGYGFMEEYPMARMYRDVRVGTIGGGSSEIMREIIAKIVIDGQGYAKSKSSGDGIVERKRSVSGDNGASDHKNGRSESVHPELGIDEIVKGIQSKASAVDALGKTLKFDFGGEQITIDGTGAGNQVSANDADADCTIKLSKADFHKLVSGDLNPMNAVMSGKVKIDGDMGLAMKLQTLFS